MCGWRRQLPLLPRQVPLVGGIAPSFRTIQRTRPLESQLTSDTETLPGEARLGVGLRSGPGGLGSAGCCFFSSGWLHCHLATARLALPLFEELVTFCSVAFSCYMGTPVPPQSGVEKRLSLG